MKKFLKKIKLEQRRRKLLELCRDFEEEYWQVERDGKLCEPVVFRRIAAMVIGMIICMSAMGFSAYAFFTSNVTSGNNKIEAAQYQAEYVVVQGTDTILPLEGTEHPTYGLQEGEYQITIRIPESVTASKGYCKIIIGETEFYYTTVLAAQDELTFTFTNDEEYSVICFIANWGSCSETDAAKIIESGEDIAYSL